MSHWSKGNPLVARSDRSNKHHAVIAIVFSVSAFIGLSGTSCFAQFNPAFPNMQLRGGDALSSELMSIPVEPLSKFAFERAKSALAEGETTEGLETLQSLLEETSDFFQVEEREVKGSFHSEIEQTLGEHREDYERLFGDSADQLLSEAIKTKDTERLRDLTRRYKMTQAGQKALKMLAHHIADQGDLTGGNQALLLSIRTGPKDGDASKQVEQLARYLALSNQNSELTKYLSTTGRQIEADTALTQTSNAAATIATEGESLLFDWSNPFGGPSQSGRTAFAPAMFSDAWANPLIDQYDFFLGNQQLEEARLQEAQRIAQAVETSVWSRSRRSAFPAGRALIVDGRVIVPGYASIKSFDLETGEIDGVGVNIDQSFEYLHEFTAAPTLMNDPFREEVRKLFFSLRGWRDLTSASLSSDGKYVYAVSSCQLAGTVAPEYLSRSNQRHELLPQSFNQLHAYELNAGLRNRWSVGTIAEGTYLPFERDEGVAREIFFYGAPLSIDGSLYIIGEERSQVSLYELDRETGAVIWSVGLLNAPQGKDIVRDPSRRMAGIIPAYIKGLLICPTGGGVITAINPLTRQVVWRHQYEKTRRIVENRFMFRRGARNREQTVSQSIETFLGDDRWFDAKVVTAGEYVLHTPPDSDELICVRALDGETVWEEELFRLRSLSMGCVFDDALVIVGKSEISAMNIADGHRIWSSPIPPPSGRGLRMGNRFVQPLMTGEILIIDLATGRLLARSPMPGNRVIGNLTAANGRIVAVSGIEVIAFQSDLQFEETVAAAGSQAAQDSLEGELALQRGDRSVGMQTLSNISIDELPERAKTVLAWAKLDGLENEFDEYRSQADQIENLLNSDQQRFLFLKALANGLKVSGDQLGAFKNFLRLYEQLSERDSLRDVDGLHELSEQRWALAEIITLYESQPVDVQQQYRTVMEDWLASSKSERAVVSFLKSFPIEQIDAAVVLKRVEQIENVKENSGAINSIYEILARHTEVSTRSAATLGLARLALAMQDGTAANVYLKRLGNPDVQPLGATRTVGEIVAAIRTDSQNAEFFNGVPDWPVNVAESEKTIPFAKSSRSQIPMMGPHSIALKGWTFFLNPMGSEIDVYDQHGRRLSKISTGVISTRLPIGSSLGRYVETSGHRALIVLADRFLLVDFQKRKDLPRIIANELLITEDQNPYGTDTFVDSSQAPRVGFRTFWSPSPFGTPAGNLGALTKSILCYGRGSEFTAIDPDHGNVLWKRHDLEPGSEIFCDDEYVLTMAPGKRSFRIYRSIDGSFAGTSDVPPNAIDSIMDRENGDWGRYLPVVASTAEAFRFELYDPVAKATVWQFATEPGATWTTVDGQDIAILSPNEKLTILSGLSGEELLSKTIPVSAKIKSLSVIAYENQWIAFPGTGPPLNYDFSYPSLITQTIEKTVNGTVVAIDQQTQEILWAKEIDDQKITTQAPLEWPVLIFGNSSGRVVRGLILNRLTGEEIVNREWEFDRSWIHWQAMIQPMRILVGYGRKTVTLDCTVDLTMPINPPEEDPVPPQSE